MELTSTSCNRQQLLSWLLDILPQRRQIGYTPNVEKVSLSIDRRCLLTPLEMRIARTILKRASAPLGSYVVLSYFSPEELPFRLRSEDWVIHPLSQSLNRLAVEFPRDLQGGSSKVTPLSMHSKYIYLQSFFSECPTPVKTNLLHGSRDNLFGVLGALVPLIAVLIGLRDGGGLAWGPARNLYGLHDSSLLRNIDGVLESLIEVLDAIVLGPQVIVQPPPVRLSAVFDGLVELLLYSLLVLSRKPILRRFSH